MSACICIDLSLTNAATNCAWQQYNCEKRKRPEEEFFLLLPVWMKENNTLLPKKNGSHRIIWFSVKSPEKALRPLGFYIPKQVYCPRRCGCCDSTERRFAQSERLWPLHSECRITSSTATSSSTSCIYLCTWGLGEMLPDALNSPVYASQRPESLQFFCVHIVSGCPSKGLEMMHSHPLQDTFVSGPPAATATLPTYHSSFCLASCYLLSAAAYNIIGGQKDQYTRDIE